MPEFDTPHPIRIRIEQAKGDVTIRLVQTATTRVELVSSSDQALAETRVELRGDELVVIAPRRSGLFRSSSGYVDIDIDIEAPAGSSLDAQLQSADLEVHGPLAVAEVKAGSGGVVLDRVLEDLQVSSGSGDVRVAHVGGPGRLRSGSGDINVDDAVERLECNTASGDVSLGRVTGRADVRTASGDVQVNDSSCELQASTASGDQTVLRTHAGTLRLRSASGEVFVGVADGVAAWLDITTISGSVSSALEGSAEPAEGEARVAVHVSTVSGDVTLAHA